jgi:hypothetical protein
VFPFQVLNPSTDFHGTYINAMPLERISASYVFRRLRTFAKSYHQVRRGGPSVRRAHCLRGKGVLRILSVMLIALVIQHAIRMRRIVLSSVANVAVQCFFSSPYGLINVTIHKRVF